MNLLIKWYYEIKAIKAAAVATSTVGVKSRKSSIFSVLKLWLWFVFFLKRDEFHPRNSNAYWEDYFFFNFNYLKLKFKHVGNYKNLAYRKRNIAHDLDFVLREEASQLIENRLVRRTKRDMLPLLIGQIKYPENLTLLEKRLKGEIK